jgi:organic radical activating enzyme
MDWPEREKTWENLYLIADTVEEIYLTGGEPTLAIEQYKLFDSLIEKGLSKKIKLKYIIKLKVLLKKKILMTGNQ